MTLLTSPQRLETKYVVPTSTLPIFLELISSAGMSPIYNSRLVNSLYYDTVDLLAVADNLSGIMKRKKYRLRWYHSQYPTSAVFEVKEKTGLLGVKHTTDRLLLNQPTLFCSQPATIINDTSFLNQHPSLISLFPQTVCTYHRSYYQLNLNLRATVDSDLMFYQASRYPSSLHLHSIFPFNIVELKYSVDYKHYLSSLFTQAPIPSQRCSKYLLSHAYLNNISYL